jgi:hypothetical protein
MNFLSGNDNKEKKSYGGPMLNTCSWYRGKVSDKNSENNHVESKLNHLS